MESKKCTKCGEVKPLHAFYKNKSAKDGLQYRCKICISKAHKELFNNRKNRNSITYPQEKKCYICDEVKKATEFNKARSAHDGLQKCCRGCQSKKHLEYKKRNHESIKDRGRKWYHNNKDKVNDYLARTKESRSAQQKEYREKNNEEVKKRDRLYRIKNKDVLREKKKIYIAENKKKIAEWQRKWRLKNACKVRDRKRRYSRHIVDNLEDTYIKSLISGNYKLKTKEIPQELIELTREQLKLHRAIKDH